MRGGGYAVPLFDTFDMHTTDGMFQAFEEKRPMHHRSLRPVFEQPNAAATWRTSASRCLDRRARFVDAGSRRQLRAVHARHHAGLHRRDVRWLEAAPGGEHRADRAVVRAARAVGVQSRPSWATSARATSTRVRREAHGFTDPAEVERFVAETGVDFLAVAVGSAHGVYQGEPQLDLELLDEIRRRVEIPLVMHGGSGLRCAVPLRDRARHRQDQRRDRPVHDLG